MKEKYMMKENVGDKIKEKMTVTELADRVGVTRCYMSEILNRRRKNVGRPVARLIARIVDEEVDDIFEVIM